jgi:hypothetical protein
MGMANLGKPSQNSLHPGASQIPIKMVMLEPTSSNIRRLNWQATKSVTSHIQTAPLEAGHFREAKPISEETEALVQGGSHEYSTWCTTTVKPHAAIFLSARWRRISKNWMYGCPTENATWTISLSQHFPQLIIITTTSLTLKTGVAPFQGDLTMQCMVQNEQSIISNYTTTPILSCSRIITRIHG